MKNLYGWQFDEAPLDLLSKGYSANILVSPDILVSLLLPLTDFIFKWFVLVFFLLLLFLLCVYAELSINQLKLKSNLF